MYTDLAWSPSCWQSAHLDEKSATRRSDPPSRYTDASWDCARVTGTVLQQPERKTTTTAVHTHTSESVYNTAPSNDKPCTLIVQRKTAERTTALAGAAACATQAHSRSTAGTLTGTSATGTTNSVTIGWPHHIAIAAASGSTARSFFAD